MATYGTGFYGLKLSKIKHHRTKQVLVDGDIEKVAL